MTSQRVQGGFTLLELVVVVALIGVLGWFAIDRILALRVDAERVAMQRTVASMKSAAGMVLAQHIVEDRLAELQLLEGNNPAEVLLAEPPPNYAGAYAESEPPVPPGNWYFDLARNQFVYRVRNADYFRADGPRADEARFRLTLDYSDLNRDEEFTPGADKVRGLQLRRVGPYSWLNEPIVEGLRGNDSFGPRGL